MVTFFFTKYAEKQFGKLPEADQARIINKLTLLKTHPDIFSVLKVLKDFPPATHRLRVGSYRLILQLKEGSEGEIDFWVLKAQHRKDVYR